ncbi:unnamed protein product [Dicrocoelium dendriticum]|nr:unnamed protein product [Dicrocoelium dendriticum]
MKLSILQEILLLALLESKIYSREHDKFKYNGSDPDLSFLDTIEEVSGYVYLSRNEVRRIPLKSLKVIRGEPAYQFGDEYGSLIVTRNGRNLTYGLETIDLRSIVAVCAGNM